MVLVFTSEKYNTDYRQNYRTFFIIFYPVQREHDVKFILNNYKTDEIFIILSKEIVDKITPLRPSGELFVSYSQ